MASSVTKKLSIAAVFSIFLAGPFASANSEVSGAGESQFCTERLSWSASFEDLQDKITRCQIQRVDDLLPLLSKEHLSHYVLLHHSESLQGASKDDPRAILYGKDAKLVLSWNGKPDQVRYNNIEVLVFRDATQSFEARDIEFPKDGAKQVPVQFSNANPALCLSCHQNDPRPNWQTYPLWPVAFGGEDDVDFRAGEGVHFQDSKEFQSFLKGEKKKGRYRFLSDLPVVDLPNTTFGSLLQALNLKRVARKIAAAPELQKYRYALLGAVSCYYSDHFNQIERYVPSPISASFKLKRSDLEHSTSQVNSTDFVDRVQQLKSYHHRAPQDARVQQLLKNLPGDLRLVSDSIVASLRWLIENQGISTDDWAMQPYAPTYNFENGYVGIAQLRAILSDALLKAPEDLALSQALQEEGLSDLEGTCHQLQMRSLESLSGTNISTQAVEVK
jgi:hypothetical protein